jgi:Holliday junction resolvase RusA-like endonuclease
MTTRKTCNEKKTILILPVTPSLNKVGGFWQRHDDKKRYKKALINYEYLPFCKIYKDCKKRLIIQRDSNKLLDVDNYHGGCKQMIDVIKEKGFIIDDSPKYCEIIFRDQVKCKKNEQKTTVEIQALESMFI